MLLIGSDSRRGRSLRKVAKLDAELSRLEAAHRATQLDLALLEGAGGPEASAPDTPDGATCLTTGPHARSAHTLFVARRREEAYGLAVESCRADLAAARGPYAAVSSGA